MRNRCDDDVADAHIDKIICSAALFFPGLHASFAYGGMVEELAFFQAHRQRKKHYPCKDEKGTYDEVSVENV